MGKWVCNKVWLTQSWHGITSTRIHISDPDGDDSDGDCVGYCSTKVLLTG